MDGRMDGQFSSNSSSGRLVRVCHVLFRYREASRCGETAWQAGPEGGREREQRIRPKHSVLDAIQSRIGSMLMLRRHGARRGR